MSAFLQETQIFPISAPPPFFFFCKIQKSQSPQRPLKNPLWNIQRIYSRWHGGVSVLVPSSVLQQILQADRCWGDGGGGGTGGSKSPASPACAPLLLCSAGLLRVMDELKSLSIRQGRLKGSDKRKHSYLFFFFFPQEVKINSANSVNHTPKHTWKRSPGVF